MNGKEVCVATPEKASDVRQRLAAVLSFARADKRILTPLWENPARWEDHLERTLDTGDHEPGHHPALPYFRAGKFIAAVRQGPSPVIALALEWHVISATRGCEAINLDWSWFDWANECVVYPASIMKMRRAHRAPLTARHNEILDTLLAGAEPPESGPVFSVQQGKPLSGASIRRAMHVAHGKDITLHGFRAAFGTWARAETYAVTLPTGQMRRVRIYDEALIEECLAHVVGGSVRNAYVRDDFLELRRPIMGDWAAYCGKVLEASEVRSIRGRQPVAVAA
jgi:integrase